MLSARRTRMPLHLVPPGFLLSGRCDRARGCRDYFLGCRDDSFRPAVQSGCPNVCVLTCVLQGTRNACPSVGLERAYNTPFCYPTGEILLPSWAANFLQLGSSVALFYAFFANESLRRGKPLSIKFISFWLLILQCRQIKVAWPSGGKVGGGCISLSEGLLHRKIIAIFAVF